ncbi:molybdopterin-guanine dinucleotide biosynthesis protein B [Paenibacillus sp. J22TS3]|uniref:molybdopterin-guanine dinucleotide biosynthesis protein B n=1 Tax=Paenibacillus sp. J22TS3 TaxID=2807192 RepID=UPI001BCE55A0|nr:molybdopterin-guanine dinucleotide biosynthesis protein B [Paenibacillus sp. J22TS3]
MSRPCVPVFQIVGYKNTGKTHLVSRLVSQFTAEGLRVAVIKHDYHGFEIDREGTDTYQISKSGAAAVAITSQNRTAVVEEHERSLGELIDSFNKYDLILVEGFKHENYPKLVLIRREEDTELLRKLAGIRGTAVWPSFIAGDSPLDLESSLRRFDIGDTTGIAAYIRIECGL